MRALTTDRRRLAILALPVVAFFGGLATLAFVVPGLLANQSYPVAVTQPIAFNHQVHTELARLDCIACHHTAATDVSAGLPAVQECMGCHIPVSPGPGGSEAEEITKLQMAWVRDQSIDWVRVHRLPDHTRFDHGAHVQANVPCATCHGDVSQMPQVTQVRPLKMGDCVACHVEASAPTDCATCHF